MHDEQPISDETTDWYQQGFLRRPPPWLREAYLRCLPICAFSQFVDRRPVERFEMHDTEPNSGTVSNRKLWESMRCAFWEAPSIEIKGGLVGSCCWLVAGGALSGKLGAEAHHDSMFGGRELNAHLVFFVLASLVILQEVVH